MVRDVHHVEIGRCIRLLSYQKNRLLVGRHRSNRVETHPMSELFDVEGIRILLFFFLFLAFRFLTGCPDCRCELDHQYRNQQRAQARRRFDLCLKEDSHMFQSAERLGESSRRTAADWTVYGTRPDKSASPLRTLVE